MLWGTKAGKILFVGQFNNFAEIAKKMLYDLFEIKKSMKRGYIRLKANLIGHNTYQ